MRFFLQLVGKCCALQRAQWPMMVLCEDVAVCTAINLAGTSFFFKVMLFFPEGAWSSCGDPTNSETSAANLLRQHLLPAPWRMDRLCKHPAATSDLRARGWTASFVLRGTWKPQDYNVWQMQGKGKKTKNNTPCKAHTTQLQSGAEQYTQQQGSGKCRLFQRGCIFRRPSDTTRNITSYTYLYIDLVFFHHSVVLKKSPKETRRGFQKNFLKVGHFDRHWVNSDCWNLITLSWVFAQDDSGFCPPFTCSAVMQLISLRLVDTEETTTARKTSFNKHVDMWIMCIIKGHTLLHQAFIKCFALKCCVSIVTKLMRSNLTFFFNL